MDQSWNQVGLCVTLQKTPNLLGFLGSGLCDPSDIAGEPFCIQEFCFVTYQLIWSYSQKPLTFSSFTASNTYTICFSTVYMFDFDWIKDALCYLPLLMTCVLKYLEVYIWYFKYFVVYIWYFKSYFFCPCILRYTIQYMIQKSGQTIHNTYPDLTTMCQIFILCMCILPSQTLARL